MAKVTPQEYAEKWRRRIGNATEDMRRGIERVTVAPGEQAAANQEAMRSNLNEAIDSGRWARRTRGVSLQDWKKAALDKGVGRVSSGAQAAEGKMASVAAELLPAVDAAAAKVRAMPKVTIEDSINRSGEFIREMHKFKDR